MYMTHSNESGSRLSSDAATRAGRPNKRRAKQALTIPTNRSTARGSLAVFLRLSAALAVPGKSAESWVLFQDPSSAPPHDPSRVWDRTLRLAWPNTATLGTHLPLAVINAHFPGKGGRGSRGGTARMGLGFSWQVPSPRDRPPFVTAGRPFDSRMEDVMKRSTLAVNPRT
jgi:hypothetical protein